MAPLIRCKIAAFLLLVGSSLGNPVDARAYPFPGHHKQSMFLAPAGPVFVPMVPVAAAPVVVVSIPSTPVYYYQSAAVATATPTYLAPETSTYVVAPGDMTTTLTQQDLNELIVGLREEDERLKGEKTAASERKAQLITKAWEMIAEKRAVEVDDLEAIDKQLGRRLVDLVMKNPSGGSGGLQVLPAGSAPQGYYPAQYAPYARRCGHYYRCNCYRRYR